MKKTILKASAYALALGCALTFVIFLPILMQFKKNHVDLLICIIFGIIFGIFIFAILIYYSFIKQTQNINNMIKKESKILGSQLDFIDYKDNNYTALKKFIEMSNNHFNQLCKKENILKKRQNTLNFIINNIDQGIILLDDNKKIKIINNKALSILKDILPSNEDLENRELKIPQIVNIYNTAIKTSKSINTNLEAKDSNKSVNIYAILFDDNKVNQGVFILLTDRTEISRLQKMRDEVAANVTHELKTPLTSIVGFIELLKNGDHDEDTRKYFYNVIDSEAQRLFRLIDDMLLLSQIENMNNSVFTQKCDIRKEIEESLKHLIPLAKKNNISINFDSNDEIFIEASSIRLQQLFSNIIGNAIKYNFPNGKIDIILYKDKDLVITEIKDTGIGIAPEHIEKIFERFFRSDKSRASEIPGTGLGLAISKDIVSMYGGEISVDSQVGKGSKFTISFPICNK